MLNLKWEEDKSNRHTLAQIIRIFVVVVLLNNESMVKTA